MKYPLVFTFFLLFISVAGCSSLSKIQLYNGPALPSSEEGTVVLPEAFEVIELNGQPVSDNRLRFRTGDLDIKLPSGEHILVFQYKDFWQIDDDNHETVTSGPITFKLNLEKNETLKFKMTAIKTYKEALEFSHKGSLKLVSKRQEIPGSHGQKENALILTEDKINKSTQYPNLDQLKFWWNRATYYEQNEFLTWQKSSNTPP